MVCFPTDQDALPGWIMSTQPQRLEEHCGRATFQVFVARVYLFQSCIWCKRLVGLWGTVCV